MSCSNQNEYFRAWMDKPREDVETRLLTEEYSEGLKQFMNFATNQPLTLKEGKMFCPCTKCRNNRFIDKDTVWIHLYRKGFMPGYKIWYCHGETDDMVDYNYASTSSHIIREPARVDERGMDTVQMVNDAFRDSVLPFTEERREEEPNLESRRYFDMLDAAKQPIYEGCRDGVSALSAATRLMSLKTDFNLSEECMDAFAEFGEGVLCPEENSAPSSYYDVQKLVQGFGLSHQVIDVCIDNCMIYWRSDEDRSACRFCKKPRYKDTSGRVPVPFKRMWYLPIGERLKRLYQSERTAEAMRWHAEHRSVEGEVVHPSDAEAWKHFQQIYPDFAYERRNVYLGLCTDGFSPFGKHGRQYSLWPVIVTPYNLPPSLCMKREFLFLSVLVPGPDHPKRALDIFLQPLIYELKLLWESGVLAYDVSRKENFVMRAALMWTISDFPAYGMLSGWSTHGKLSCPYCQDNIDSFQLKNGRKSCWFDCHRRFLQKRHPYRKSVDLFTKSKKVIEGPPPTLDGNYLLNQLHYHGAKRTVDCGGNGHTVVDGCGKKHNWHKQSIFWDLPYWKDQLLRHNLDVMHIEKNFFDNIMNTILNVQGKTKDNLKSRLDLADICDRSALHLTSNGKAPSPCYRLEKDAKQAFFDWIIDGVRFPDGYASNLRNCVDRNEDKFTGMKSHDCHVVMQRLFPFAFTGLLPYDVHAAIAAIGAFFRDLCTRSLSVAGIQTLETNIPLIICNLEKIFPPSFFDVMEHLPIHLPLEARLGGPVQYRWMYPFERYMYHLKKKVKNLSRVEGSIVAQCINEEASNFAGFYFGRDVRTKSRRPGRNDDGGVIPFYPVIVPSMFTQVGRLSGKGENRIFDGKELEHLHAYILENCEEMLPYETMYMGQARGANPLMTEEELDNLKKCEFAGWLKFYVEYQHNRGVCVPTWLEELSNGPLNVAVSYPMYFTRGYKFRRFCQEKRSTSNHGVSTESGDLVYYGVLREILEIRFPGMLGLKCVVFFCDWYNPIVGVGVTLSEFGVTSIHSGKKLRAYDPFILASQANQVCYIRYPRVTNRNDPWITVAKINPRGTVEGDDSVNDPLQQQSLGVVAPVDYSLHVDLVVDLTTYDDLLEGSETERGEFDEVETTSESSDGD